MDRYVKWVNVIREAIKRRIEVEEMMRGEIDRARALKASEDIERLRSKSTGRWSGVEEIRKWRELR